MRATETENIRRSLNVAIAGGGTGGHLFPGIAVAEAFRMKDPQNEILFVGVGNPFEKAALERAGYPQRTVSIEGIKGRGLWAKARAGLKIPVALFQAAGILSEMRGRSGGRCGRVRRRPGGHGRLVEKNPGGDL